jgi:hypothetical protein
MILLCFAGRVEHAKPIAALRSGGRPLSGSREGWRMHWCPECEGKFAINLLFLAVVSGLVYISASYDWHTACVGPP